MSEECFKKIVVLKIKSIIMKVENQLTEEVLVVETQLLEKFQVEELEKRYEFGWFSDLVDAFK